MVDMNQVKGAVTEGVGKLKDSAGGLTGDPGLQAEGKADQFQGQIQQDYGAFLDQAKEQLEEAAELVRDRPLLAVGVALGLGVLLGLMVTPSR